jgi:hypothetical protein
MNRLTLNLPDGLLETVMELSGRPRRPRPVVAALRTYEEELRRERLHALRGRADLLADAAAGKGGAT